MPRKAIPMDFSNNYRINLSYVLEKPAPPSLKPEKDTDEHIGKDAPPPAHEERRSPAAGNRRHSEDSIGDPEEKKSRTSSDSPTAVDSEEVDALDPDFGDADDEAEEETAEDADDEAEEETAEDGVSAALAAEWRPKILAARAHLGHWNDEATAYYDCEKKEWADKSRAIDHARRLHQEFQAKDCKQNWGAWPGSVCAFPGCTTVFDAHPLRVACSTHLHWQLDQDACRSFSVHGIRLCLNESCSTCFSQSAASLVAWRRYHHHHNNGLDARYVFKKATHGAVWNCPKHGPYQNDAIRHPCPHCAEERVESQVARLVAAGLKRRHGQDTVWRVEVQHEATGQLRHDAVCNELRMVIEVDGPTHYDAQFYLSSPQQLQHRVQIDVEKSAVMADDGWMNVRVLSQDLERHPEQVQRQLVGLAEAGEMGSVYLVVVNDSDKKKYERHHKMLKEASVPVRWNNLSSTRPKTALRLQPASLKIRGGRTVQLSLANNNSSVAPVSKVQSGSVAGYDPQTLSMRYPIVSEEEAAKRRSSGQEMRCIVRHAGVVYTCGQCDKRLRIEDLHQHIAQEHDKLDLQFRFKCTAAGCDARYRGMKEHGYQTHGPELRCPLSSCPWRRHGQASLVTEHYALKHGPLSDDTICGECGKQQFTAWRLRGHMRSAHEDRQLRCKQPDCAAIFKNSEALLYHMKKEHSTFSQRCPCHGTLFVSYLRFKDHVSRTNVKARGLHQCDKCSFRGTSPSALVEHQKTHLPDADREKFVCPQCWPPIAQTTYLYAHRYRTHMLTHEDPGHQY